MDDEVVIEIGFRTKVIRSQFRRQDYIADIPTAAAMSDDDFICAAIRTDLEQGRALIDDFILENDIGPGNVKVVPSV